MAKKKRRSRNTRQNKSMDYLAIVVWVIFILILLYCFREPIKTFFSRLGNKENVENTEDSGRIKYHIVATDLEIPAPLKDRAEQKIRHTGYTVSYNKQWKIPNWVAYELTPDELNGNAKRTNKFTVDPMVKGVSATNTDYTRSGLDRGHMAPAGDMTWDETAMQESFYFSNMCPQEPGLNRGVWKSLEEKVRDWVTIDSTLYIVCGPLSEEKDKTIGKNKVKVPHGFYKVILAPWTSTPKGIAFIFANKNEKNRLETYAVPIDSVETLTGIDFFPSLPDELEEEIDSTVRIEDWNF
ncbi:MAG: DNA/RNA non-specific endonuclease [Coprobacter sp.]|nr:DNA/RNA non-specific endonuclease [Coprobacter sp.]